MPTLRSLALLTALTLFGCNPTMAVDDDDAGDDDVGDDDVADDDAGDDDTGDDDTGDDDTGPVDADGDGWAVGEDCDDTDANVYPGAPEICDGHDTDCNGVPDDGDADGDGAGVCDDCDDGDPALNLDDADSDGVHTCDGDCDDADSTSYPDAQEECDGYDNNCNGVVPVEEADDDSDGFRVCEGDCDDADGAIHPGASEQCNGVDDDCDGLLAVEEADADNDGYRVCEDDCNDGNAVAFPGALEIPGDGLDQDCDGSDVAGLGSICYWDNNVVHVPGTDWGTLVYGDDSYQGIFYDDIEFNGLAGWHVTITMEDYYGLNDFDPFLYLHDGSCNHLAEDDNSGGDSAAQIEIELPANGTYTVIATAAAWTDWGSYVVEVEVDEAPVDFGNACGDDEWTTEMGTWSNAFGSSWTLSNSDASDGPRGPGYYHDDIEFLARAGDTIDVLAWSFDFDTYIYLLDDGCNVLDEDDDAYGGTNSRILYSAPSDGVYVLSVTSHSAGATGGFEWYLGWP